MKPVRHRHFGINVTPSPYPDGAVGARIRLGGRTLNLPIDIAVDLLAIAAPGGARLDARAFVALAALDVGASCSVTGRCRINADAVVVHYWHRVVKERVAA